MSFLDRQQGMLDGSAATARNYGSAIDQWEAHAERLKGRLKDATEKADELAEQRLFADAKIEGLRAVIAAMETEIQRSKPNSSLLQQSTRNNIAAQRMAEFLVPHGYQYDRENYKVSKVPR
jgi:chromosome segregation ATPase